MDYLMWFYNRCECGISRFGFCHYCGENLFINIVVFVLVFLFIIIKLNGKT